MTWTRFGELSADTQSLANVAGLGGSGYAVSNTVAYTGSYSYRTSGTNAPLGFAGAMGVAARCGMQFRHNGVAVGTNIPPVIGFLVDGCALAFRFNGANNDVVLTAGYSVGTTNVRTAATVNVPTLADVNTWRHVAMTAYLAASGGFVSLYVDGIQVATWTGDTQLYRSGETTPRTSITAIYAAGNGANWTGVGANTQWANYAYIDDYFADYWTGESAPTDTAVPSRRFLVSFPNEDGASVEWTPNTGANYAAVDDAPPDDDTTYVAAASSGLLDLYGFAAVTVPAGYAVRAVIPTIYARKSDAGVASTLKIVATDGVDTAESDAQALATSYGYVRHRFTLDPAGDAWTESTVNAAEFGIESAGDYS